MIVQSLPTLDNPFMKRSGTSYSGLSKPTRYSTRHCRKWYGTIISQKNGGKPVQHSLYWSAQRKRTSWTASRYFDLNLPFHKRNFGHPWRSFVWRTRHCLQWLRLWRTISRTSRTFCPMHNPNNFVTVFDNLHDTAIKNTVQRGREYIRRHLSFEKVAENTEMYQQVLHLPTIRIRYDREKNSFWFGSLCFFVGFTNYRSIVRLCTMTKLKSLEIEPFISDNGQKSSPITPPEYFYSSPMPSIRSIQVWSIWIPCSQYDRSLSWCRLLCGW